MSIFGYGAWTAAGSWDLSCADQEKRVRPHMPKNQGMIVII